MKERGGTRYNNQPCRTMGTHSTIRSLLGTQILYTVKIKQGRKYCYQQCAQQTPSTPNQKKRKQKSWNKQYALLITEDFSWQHVLDLNAHRTL